MSILIKGMEMPKSCFACDFYSGNECYLYSYGIPARYNYNPDTKPEWCELVEVPTPNERLNELILMDIISKIYTNR